MRKRYGYCGSYLGNAAPLIFRCLTAGGSLCLQWGCSPSDCNSWLTQSWARGRECSRAKCRQTRKEALDRTLQRVGDVAVEVSWADYAIAFSLQQQRFTEKMQSRTWVLRTEVSKCSVGCWEQITSTCRGLGKGRRETWGPLPPPMPQMH